MSLEKTKSDKVRTDEILLTSTISSSEKVKKEDPILTAETGKALDASTSIDAYMAAIAAQLEAMIESPELTGASFAAEESAKSSDSNDEEVLIVAEEDDEPSGPFSKQKGGSAALSIDAYINAMNAQLESIKIRRERSQLMIAQELKMTQIAAQNVRDMGQQEAYAHMATGIGQIVGATAQGVGFGVSAWKSGPFSSESQKIVRYGNERDKAEKLMNAADEYTAYTKLPDGNLKDALGAKFGQTGAGNMDPIAVSRNTLGKIDFNTTVTLQANGGTRAVDVQYTLSQAEKDMFKTFNSNALTADEQTRILQDGSAGNIGDLRKEFKTDLQSAEAGINSITADRSGFATTMNMFTGSISNLSSGIASIIHGQRLVTKAVLEAEKMNNELAARYAGQDVQLNNETASARESDLNNSIRMLREVTGADIRG